jgi:hypothetical protein
LAGVRVVVERFRGDGGEKVDVIGGMEEADVFRSGRKRAENLHTAMEGVVDDEVMSHTDTVRLHRMALAVVVFSDRRLIEVGNTALFAVGAGGEGNSGIVVHA